MHDIAQENPDSSTEPAADPIPTGKSRLELLAQEADPSSITESGKTRVLEEWFKADAVVDRARQMLKDAIKTREEKAEQVVRKLGRGHLRYKGVLYSPSAKGETIYLRKLVKKPR